MRSCSWAVPYVSSGEECEDVVVTEVSKVVTDVTEESALRNKPRLTLLETLLGMINPLPVEQLLYQEVRLCKLR